MLNMREMLTGIVQRMSNVTRYSHHPIIRPENVAEHSWYVSLYCYLIALDLRSRGFEVDFEKLFRRAVVHDLDEAVTGDFVRDFKYSYPGLKKAIAAATQQIFVQLVDKLGVDKDRLFDDWQQSKAGDLEGAILMLSDFLAVIAYIYSEKMMGNQAILPIFKEVGEWIVKAFYDLPESYKKALLPYVQGASDILVDDIGTEWRIELS